MYIVTDVTDDGARGANLRDPNTRRSYC
jgi:hypothetical protein